MVIYGVYIQFWPTLSVLLDWRASLLLKSVWTAKKDSEHCF